MKKNSKKRENFSTEMCHTFAIFCPFAQTCLLCAIFLLAVSLPNNTRRLRVKTCPSTSGGDGLSSSLEKRDRSMKGLCAKEAA